MAHRRQCRVDSTVPSQDISRLPLHLALTFLVRGSLIWVLVRVIAYLGLLFVRARLGPEVRSGLLAPIMVTIALCAVDFARRRESVLMANLGVSAGQTVGLMLCPALVGEIAYGAFALP